MKNQVLTTIINPPLVFGVTGAFCFLILFLLFVSTIIIRGIFGTPVMFICFVAIIYFYFYGVKRTVKDPYWLNVVIMAFMFERRKPIEFVARIFTKKDKIFYR